MSNYNFTRRKKATDGDHDILGIVLIVVSGFLLICSTLPIVFGFIGSLIQNVLLGLFGIFNYALLSFILACGICVLSGRKVSITAGRIALIVGIVVCIMTLLQLATSLDFLEEPFSDYLVAVYSYKYTAGGLIFGLLAYGLQYAASLVVAFVVLSLCIFAFIALLIISFISNRPLLFKRKHNEDLSDARQANVHEFTENVPAQKVRYHTPTTLFVGNIITDKALPSNNGLFNVYDSESEVTSVRDKSAAEEVLFSPSEKPTTERAELQSFNVYGFGVASQLKSTVFRPVPDKLSSTKIVHEGSVPRVVIPTPKYIESPDNETKKIINSEDLLRLKTNREKTLSSTIGFSSISGTKKDDYYNDSPIINASNYRGSKNLGFSEPYFTPKQQPKFVEPKIDNNAQTGYESQSETNAVLDSFSSYNKFDNVPENNDALQRNDEIINSGSFSVRSPKLNNSNNEIIKSEEKTNSSNTFGRVEEDEVIDKSEKNFSFSSDSGYYQRDIVNSSNSKLISDSNPDDGIDNEPEIKPIEKPKRERKANKIISGQVDFETFNRNKVSDTTLELPKPNRPYVYHAPSFDLLMSSSECAVDTDEVEQRSELIESVLNNLGFPVKVEQVISGPTVTRYEVKPLNPSCSVKKIVTLNYDLEYALASGDIRIEAPVPHKQAIGIEVANSSHNIVRIRDILESSAFSKSDAALPIALGKNVAGEIVVGRLEKMPHLLIAGATGTGKSVCLNSIILSLIYKCSPEDLRIILVDPKRLEFASYYDLPHLLLRNSITEIQQIINAFDYLINEMERRYVIFENLAKDGYPVKTLAEYNSCTLVRENKISKLPYLVMVVDELSDLMGSTKRDIEPRIRTITQKSRAAGIHLILATQRPSVDVITGTIKINFPTRIAFKVVSNVDSRTILEQGGAEKLIGNGDMFYMNASEPIRVQGAYADLTEISNVVEYVKANNVSIFDEEIEKFIMKARVAE